MALSVDYIYQYALDLVNKNQSGGLEDTRFCSLWNGEQSSYHADLCGRFQRMNNGKEGIQTGLIENETIIQKLSPFIKNAPISIISGTGAKPADFIYRLSLKNGNYEMIKINHDQLPSVLADTLGDAPSVANNKYYYIEYNNGYSVYPSTLTTVGLDYVCRTTDVFWNSTRDVNNRKVYNPTGSIQPLWDDVSCREITERMLKKLGVPLKDKDFQNFGQSVINTGD